MTAEWTITSGDTLASFTRRGAFLRRFETGGESWVSTFPLGEPPLMMDGAQLAPWPGRVRDGRWRCGSDEHQLPLTEPERHNAIHGLAHACEWTLLERLGDSGVLLGTRLEPSAGWPGEMLLELTATVSSGRLEVTVEALNVSGGPLPFGYGAHPYLRLGGVPRPEWRIRLPFDSRLEVDERLLPLRLAPIRVPDLRAGAVLGDVALDHAYTEPARDADGWWWVEVSHGDRRLRLGSRDMAWVQVYTPEDDTLLAVEPMSVAADAFNGGPGSAGLVWLNPSQSHRVGWQLRVG